MTDPLVRVRALCVTFMTGAGPIPAVDGIDFDVGPGETLAILGESGSGKTATVRALMRLLPRSTIITGDIRIGDAEPLRMTDRALTAWRGRGAAMVFQEPRLALDPVFTVGHQLQETIRRHERVSGAEARRRALELFELVQIPAASRRLQAYPHELSGGLRQRAMLAVALSARPQLLLADEPTTALDVTVQMQILVLLRRLQHDLGMSVILVTHDIGVAAELADRVVVMYAGQLIEVGTARAVLKQPAHPYTVGLLAAAVRDTAPGTRLPAIGGAPPSPGEIVSGCRFAPRCPHRHAPCCARDIPWHSMSEHAAARCLLLTGE